MMKERPILFSAPMVRAILDGTKTQTRRIVKDQPYQIGKPRERYHGGHGCGDLSNYTGELEEDGTWWITDEFGGVDGFKCPYGQIGDRLWVRENVWVARKDCKYPHKAETWVGYPADGEKCNSPEFWKSWGFKLAPSIHMPRAKSRITLEITDIRIERLQDICEYDAKAESCQDQKDAFGIEKSGSIVWYAKHAYVQLWNAINGKDAWLKNPWVWVVEFKILEVKERN